MWGAKSTKEWVSRLEAQAVEQGAQTEAMKTVQGKPAKLVQNIKSLLH